MCLVIILYFVDLSELIQAVQRANYSLILVGICVTILWLVIRAVAWRTFLNYRARLTDVFLALCDGYLMNNLLPFRLGELGRAFIISQDAQLDFWQVLPSVFIERLLDAALGAGLFISVLPFVVGVNWAQQAAVGTLVLVGTGFVLLFSAARHRTQVEVKLDLAGKKIPILGRLMGSRAPEFLEGLSIVANPTIFFPGLFWICINWLLGIVQFYVYFRAFFPEAQLLWAAFGLGALALGVIAPSTPGNIGVYELALVSAVTFFTGNPSQSAALALTIHALQYLITGIPGVYGLAREGESLAGLYRSVTQLRHPR